MIHPGLRLHHLAAKYAKPQHALQHRLVSDRHQSCRKDAELSRSERRQRHSLGMVNLCDLLIVNSTRARVGVVEPSVQLFYDKLVCQTSPGACRPHTKDLATFAFTLAA